MTTEKKVISEAAAEVRGEIARARATGEAATAGL